MEHCFNVEWAQKYGVEEAAFLAQMRFWILRNRREQSQKHRHEGRWWTFNSLSGLHAAMPYFTERQLERIIAKLLKEGVIRRSYFGKKAVAKVAWYAFEDEREFLKEDKRPVDSSCHETVTTQAQNGLSRFGDTLSPFGDNPCHGLVTPCHGSVTTNKEQLNSQLESTAATETSTASAPVTPPPSREAAKRQRIADALFDFFHRPATRDQVDDLLADVEEYRKRGIKVSAAEIEQATKDARRWWDSTSRTGNPCRIEPVRKALSDLVAPKQDAPAAAATAAPVPDPLAESTVELRPMWEIWEEERAREAARIPRIPPHLVPLLMKGRDLTPEQQAECDEQERRWQAQQREFAKPIPHVRMLVRDGAAASSASVN